MACACTKRKTLKFLWYDPINAESVEPIVYNSEIEAKAKALREKRRTGNGGKYTQYDPDMSIGSQIALAESR